MRHHENPAASSRRIRSPPKTRCFELNASSRPHRARLIQRTRHEAGLGYRNGVQRPVGHRQVGRAAVQRIHPRNPAVMIVHELPRVDLPRRVQVIHRSRLRGLVLDLGVSPADALEPIGGVEADQIGERGPPAPERRPAIRRRGLESGMIAVR